MAASYGWTIPDILELTLKEIEMLTNSANRRVKAMYPDTDTKGNKKGPPKSTAKHKLTDETLDTLNLVR